MNKITNVFSVFVCLFVLGCNNSQAQVDEIKGEKEGVVAIYSGVEGSTEIESYQAVVKSFYTNNRLGIFMEEKEEFRMSMKMINNEVYTRIDLNNEAFPDLIPRSVIGSPKVTYLVKRLNSEIEARYPQEEEQHRNILMEDFEILGRLNIEDIYERSNRLSLDIIDNTPEVFTVNLPTNHFPIKTTEGYSSEVVSFKMSFDVKNETLKSTEMNLVENDGTKVNIKTEPIYEVIDGQIIKVGQKRTVFNDFPDVPSVMSEDVEIFESIDDIPIITSTEIEELEKEGKIAPYDGPLVFGDPSNPDFEEVFTEYFYDVEVNSLDDQLFKIALEG